MCRIYCHFKLCKISASHHFKFLSNCKFLKEVACGTYDFLVLTEKNQCVHATFCFLYFINIINFWACMCRNVCHLRFCKKVNFSKNGAYNYITPTRWNMFSTHSHRCCCEDSTPLSCCNLDWVGKFIYAYNLITPNNCTTCIWRCPCCW